MRIKLVSRYNLLNRTQNDASEVFIYHLTDCLKLQFATNLPLKDVS